MVDCRRVDSTVSSKISLQNWAIACPALCPNSMEEIPALLPSKVESRRGQAQQKMAAIGSAHG